VKNMDSCKFTVSSVEVTVAMLAEPERSVGKRRLGRYGGL